MSKNKSSKLISNFSSQIDSNYKSSDKIETSVNLNDFNLLKSEKIDKRTKIDKKKINVVINMLESIHNKVFQNCITTIETDIIKYNKYFLELVKELKNDEDEIDLDKIKITIKKWKKEIKIIFSIIKDCIDELILKYFKSNRLDVQVSINYKDVNKHITLENLYILMHNYINLNSSFKPLYIGIDEEFNLIKHEKKHLNVNTSYNLLYKHYYYSLLCNYIFKGLQNDGIDHEIFVIIFSEMINIIIAKIFIDSLKKYRTNQTQRGIEKILSHKLDDDVAIKIAEHIKKPLFNKVYK
jgi:hypothetical protein